MMTQSSIGGLVGLLMMGLFTYDDTVKHWWTGWFVDDGTVHL